MNAPVLNAVGVGAAGVGVVIDLQDAALDRGAYLLLRRALRQLPPGSRLEVRGRDPALAVHLRAFCRSAGVDVEWPERPSEAVAYVIGRGFDRDAGVERAGAADPCAPNAVVGRPPARWGLAPRGALVETNVPAVSFLLAEKDMLWSADAPRLYAQAAAAQWDPATAVPWQAPFELPRDVEDAIVQVMTYLIENETAALLVPAHFVARVHPHFREVMQLLAIQVADEARHIEVFTRRALLRRKELGLSTAGGQSSLQTLLQEPDFAEATFLLSVLGEGSFLSLLWFLHEHAPDPVTAEVVRLAAKDEARHVAFGLSHLQRQAGCDPNLRARLARVVERRHEALRHTAGLNQEVHDALVLLAAGSWDPMRLADGHDRVVALAAAMGDARTQRLGRLGFTSGEADALSALHTRNFM
jgi:TusA-related sulfurtransferase